MVAARAASLRHASDAMPGIRRELRGTHARYLGPDGAAVRDAGTLARIRSLAIPPAWSEVWICPDPDGHLQATGRDARGRKQYRYHARWRQVRDETKFHRMIAFGEALPRIRERVAADLARPGLPREKVLATVTRLLEVTCIRVGNEEYAKQNGHYGLTTLRCRHVDISGSTIRFHFRGKSGKRHDVGVKDRRLARILHRCQAVPGQELFQYVDDDGQRHSICSDDVNQYLRAISGEEFSAKDFRTWTGTVLAAMALQAVGDFGSQTQAKRNVVQAIERVAERLGNTPAVCRSCYVHPGVLASYLDGTLRDGMPTRFQGSEDSETQLHPEEAAVLDLLRRRLALESDESRRRRR
jgi:DNA topoisomerase-1